MLVSLCRHKAGLFARARHICVTMTTVSFTRVWESSDVAAPTSNLIHFTVSHDFTACWQPGWLSRYSDYGLDVRGTWFNSRQRQLPIGTPNGCRYSDYGLEVRGTWFNSRQKQLPVGSPDGSVGIVTTGWTSEELSSIPGIGKTTVLEKPPHRLWDPPSLSNEKRRCNSTSPYAYC